MAKGDMIKGVETKLPPENHGDGTFRQSAAVAVVPVTLGAQVRALLERLEAQANVLAESETNHAVDWARAHVKAALDGLRQAHPAVVMLEQQLEVLEGQKVTEHLPVGEAPASRVVKP